MKFTYVVWIQLSINISDLAATNPINSIIA